MTSRTVMIDGEPLDFDSTDPEVQRRIQKALQDVWPAIEQFAPRKPETKLSEPLDKKRREEALKESFDAIEQFALEEQQDVA